PPDCHRCPTRRASDLKRKAGKDVTVNIEIFSNPLDAPNWGEGATPFRYNNITRWSVGDPFLTASGDTLYFTSDMDGGIGGTDIRSEEHTSELQSRENL